MSKTVTLSSNDRNTVSNGLHVAADTFGEHVKEFQALAEALRAGKTMPLFAAGEAGAKAAETLAEQFAQQREDSLVLHRLIHQATSVTLTIWEEGDDD